MNVFARNRNTYPPFSHARKELEKEHFIFSLNEQLSNVANGKNGEGKNHNFLRKENKRKYIILGEILFILSHVSITKANDGEV